MKSHYFKRISRKVAFYGHFDPIWHDIACSKSSDDKYPVRKALKVTKKVNLQYKIIPQ